MGLLIDASTPAVSLSGTTASFTPPAGSLIVVLAIKGGGAVPPTPTNTPGGTFLLLKSITSPNGAAIYVCDVGASTSMTVTCTGSVLQVFVLTGAAAASSQTGAVGAATASFVTMTPTVVGSRLFVVSSDSNGTLGATTGTTKQSSDTTTVGGEFGYHTALTSSLTSTSVGFSATGSSAEIAAEILPPGATAVTKSRQMLANTKASVTKSRQMLANTKASVTKSRQFLANTKARVTKSRQFLANTLANNVVTKAVEFLANTKASITKSRQFLANTKASVTKSRQFLANTRIGPIAKSREFLANTLAGVAKTLTVLANTQTPPTAAEILAEVLVADSLDAVLGGCEIVDANLNVLVDISDDLLGGTVSRDCFAKIQGDCRIKLSNELAWGTDLVRLYTVIEAEGLAVRWNVGVFSLTTPKEPLGESPVTFDVQGYDRVSLLNRQVGDAYTVAAGTSYLTATKAAIAAAGLSTSTVLFDGTSQALTLPIAMSWPFVMTGTPTTWLDIVNDLLAAINYRPLWADGNGYFRSEPYADPTTAAPTYTFDADAIHSIGITNRVLTRDLWAAPNTWIFVQSTRASGAATPTVGDGIYVVTNPSDGPSSIAGRGGLTYPQTFQVAAADQASLVALGNAQVASDLRTSATLAVSTAPFPGAGHFDVFLYHDTDLDSLTWKVQATAWQLDLTGADMSWSWSQIGTVS